MRKTNFDRISPLTKIIFIIMNPILINIRSKVRVKYEICNDSAEAHWVFCRIFLQDSFYFT